MNTDIKLLTLAFPIMACIVAVTLDSKRKKFYRLLPLATRDKVNSSVKGNFSLRFGSEKCIIIECL